MTCKVAVSRSDHASSRGNRGTEKSRALKHLFGRLDGGRGLGRNGVVERAGVSLPFEGAPNGLKGRMRSARPTSDDQDVASAASYLHDWRFSRCNVRAEYPRSSPRCGWGIHM